ncbi:MAG TPA: M28 family metallopeptidase [Clostridia bacterium]|nr:M28 family metallopeptidase [Clostridia bacterium]
MKKLLFYGVCIALALVVCSCAAAGGGVAADLEVLTSDELSGRLCVAQGAGKTAAFLAEKLEAAGMEPYAVGYVVPFTETLPVPSGARLVISADQGEVVLNEGVDYTYFLLPSVTIKGAIQRATGSGKEKSFSIRTEGGVALTLKQSDFRSGNGPVFTGASPLEDITLGLSEEAMNTVEQNVGQPVEFSYAATEQAVTLQNVMGVLPGKDRTRAVVLGAHYDHMGTVGSTIYRGAADNASGVAAVLNVISELRGAQPEVDVVFAFWNAEEVGCLGSAAAAEELKNRYEELCYINLDCVGLKNGGPVLVTTLNASGPLASSLASLLADNGSTNAVASQESMESDHQSFSFCGSVNLGQSMDALMSTIHRPSDTIEGLDVDEITKLSAALAEVLKSSSAKLMEAAREKTAAVKTTDIVWPEGNFEQMTYGEQYKYMAAVKAQLAYDEYVILPIQGGTTSVAGKDGEYFSSLAEAQRLYPLVSVPDRLGDYTLKQIHISAHLTPAVAGTEQEPYQVIKRDFSVENIAGIELFYEQNERAVVYRETYSRLSVDVEAYAVSYGWAQPAPDGEDAWITYDEEGGLLGAYVMKLSDKTIAEIQNCPLYLYDDGTYSSLLSDSPDFTLETLLTAVNLVKQSQPLISIIGFEK